MWTTELWLQNSWRFFIAIQGYAAARPHSVSSELSGQCSLRLRTAGYSQRKCELVQAQGLDCDLFGLSCVLAFCSQSYLFIMNSRTFTELLLFLGGGVTVRERDLVGDTTGAGKVLLLLPNIVTLATALFRQLYVAVASFLPECEVCTDTAGSS
jgi:hypothetical protein